MSEFEATVEAPIEAPAEIVAADSEPDENYRFLVSPLILDDSQKSAIEEEIKYNKLLSSLGQEFVVKGDVHLNNVERFLLVSCMIVCWHRGDLFHR